MKIKLLYILCCFTTVFTSCKNDKDTNGTSAFFGGKIVNPYSNYIVLSKSRKVLDTIKLDEKNRFAYKIDKAEPGLYTFYDGKELQTVLIQPNDSLLLRLNTYDFDESLVYSGIGAKENNFLMELFLLNEEDEKNTLALSQLMPEAFEQRLNALRDDKLKKLAKFKSKYETSTLFDKLVQGNINYKYYSSKEVYPIANYSKTEKHMLEILPEDFYSYRSDINYNDDVLKDYPAYSSFLGFHFNTLALQEHFKESDDSIYNELSLDYNLKKLKIIDEKVKNKSIKNRLLYAATMRFINNSHKTEEYCSILNSFIEKSSNKKQITRAQNVVRSYQRLKPGNKIPNITLLNTNNKELGLSSIITKPTVIYFWTKTNKNHITTSHKRIKELNAKYPEVEYIAINIDSISYANQKKVLNHFDLRVHNEYRLKSPSHAVDSLSIKPINNVFIVNKKSEIVNPKANIFTIQFEQELLEVINH
ncbi:redoxin domain-containing protein [Lacinutrix sp. 5H-3-7-4]|uniref:redoxin domain-containing protein n=1 Tax=Lacinutrix sp. (strain 5H-3-7-4) TaxID=983544 RepID=UPI00020A3BD1|nr:redoxin domain-containing protein [Lacinutrix sp. 5H-3-7-4]AEH02761.1 hypothetical protein Lacal_2923 [Lacinutrix sp. 5H-3-7-4]